MKNVLIISGHTNLAASVANKTILETLNERLPEKFKEINEANEVLSDEKRKSINRGITIYPSFQ